MSSAATARRSFDLSAVPRRLIENASAAALALFGSVRMRTPRSNARAPGGRYAIAVAATIAIVAVLMFALDSWAIAWTARAPAWLIQAFEILSDAGQSGWVLVPTGVALVAIAAIASPALGRGVYGVMVALAVRIGFVFVAVGLPGLVITIVKRLIGRARPNNAYGQDAYFAPFSWSADHASLPSGHSTTAFAAAVALGALFPRARAPLLVLAAAIALSRVAVAVHYPSDVVLGAICGTVGALMVRRWFAQRRLGFVIAPDGVVRTLPGPSWRRISAAGGRLIGVR